MEHVAGFWMAGRDLANTKFTNNQIISPCPKQFGITVGANGRRYYMDWDGYSNKSDIAYRDNVSLAVGSRHGHMQIGGEWPHLAQPSKAWFVFDQQGLEAGAIPASTTSDPVADKLAYSASSIEELANQMGVPASELKTHGRPMERMLHKRRRHLLPSTSKDSLPRSPPLRFTRSYAVPHSSTPTVDPFAMPKQKSSIRMEPPFRTCTLRANSAPFGAACTKVAAMSRSA